MASTPADHSREYRRRKGARIGQGPGPEPSAPCGTYTAYSRHVRKGEQVDEACRAAYNAYQREYQRKQRRQRDDQP